MYAVENKVVDKPDREELSAFAKEEQVQGLIQSTAADLTTFVNSTVHDATHTKADIADCKVNKTDMLRCLSNLSVRSSWRIASKKLLGR